MLLKFWICWDIPCSSHPLLKKSKKSYTVSQKRFPLQEVLNNTSDDHDDEGTDFGNPKCCYCSVSRCDISSFKLKGMPFDENCNKVLSSTEDLRPFFEI
jgi:hypothetical protein